MTVENKDIKTEEEEKKVPPAEEDQEDGKKTEEGDDQKKDEFEKKEELVSAAKYNQAVRKQRELELEKRELERKLSDPDRKTAKRKVVQEDEEDEEDEEDDFYGEEKTPKKKLKDPDFEALVDEKLKPLQSKLDQREADDRKNQRSAFFKKHPEYLSSPEKWEELLDEMDNSLNPNSRDGYYKQLVKAHRILTGGTITVDPEIEKKKREMASDSSSRGDGSQRPADKKSPTDERSERLLGSLPKGFLKK